MRLALYTRVSGDEQAQRGASLDAQEAEGRRFAGREGHEVVGLFTDPGVSGREFKKRKGLQAALSALREGDADGLWVFSITRLTRSVKWWLFLAENYFDVDARALGHKDARRPGGLTLFADGREVDVSSAFSWFACIMTVAFAEAESLRGGERTRAVQRERRSKGLYQGKVALFHKLEQTDDELLAHVRSVLRERHLDAPWVHGLAKVGREDHGDVHRLLGRGQVAPRVVRRVAYALKLEVRVVEDPRQWAAFEEIARMVVVCIPFTRIALHMQARAAEFPTASGAEWNQRMVARYFKRGTAERAKA